MTRDNFFILALVFFVFLASILMPSVSTLIHPDSAGYIEFFDYRTSFYPFFLDTVSFIGLTIEYVPIIQVLIFSLSLYFLLKSLLSICSKNFLYFYVMILVANIWFISQHKAILTESIYISSIIVSIASLIFFLSKGSIKHMAIFSFMLGISIGIRPSGIAMLSIFPVALLAANNRFNKFRWAWIFALVIPIMLTQAIESSLYKRYHGDIERGSILPVIIFGKGAMIGSDFKFNGPYKKVLSEFSDELDLEYEDIRLFVKEIPYFWLKGQSLSNYEIYAQFNVLRNKRDYFAKKAGVERDQLIMELGKQRILQGIGQWIENSIHYYFASWGLRSTSFPAFVSEYNDWILKQENIPLNSSIKYLPLKGDLKVSYISMVVFPLLLAAGILSVFSGLIFLVMIILRKNIPLALMLSGILSIGVHTMILFSSFVNVATPRYTTTQFPILLLALLLFLFWILRIISNTQIFSRKRMDDTM
ncbi:hypothetical protein HOB87_03005 [Candidatus Woesearchaeota archaeon]|jgi:hypothetical protein|nr:hypothetical protein [Candidatus Woesearchaeota archaeon]